VHHLYNNSATTAHYLGKLPKTIFMLWKGRRQSSNVEDRRGSGGWVAGGGIGGVIIALLFYLLGGDSADLENNLKMTTNAPASTEANDSISAYAKVVLADTEDIWAKIFSEQLSGNYSPPSMVLFSNSTQSGCGFASAQTGPFYCPADEKVYLDLSFFNLMQTQFNTYGDFPMAYVIAHEVGHHVQNLLGITRELDAKRGRISEREYNKLSVKLELQADFFAGLWAHYNQQVNHVLEPGDIEEAIQAASAIGDDKLQMQSQGYTVPDAFTHGTSQQRMYWFKKGFTSGDIREGNTFEMIE